jgi:hypothetical protein
MRAERQCARPRSARDGDGDERAVDRGESRVAADRESHDGVPPVIAAKTTVEIGAADMVAAEPAISIATSVHKREVLGLRAEGTNATSANAQRPRRRPRRQPGR